MGYGSGENPTFLPDSKTRSFSRPRTGRAAAFLTDSLAARAYGYAIVALSRWRARMRWDDCRHLLLQKRALRFDVNVALHAMHVAWRGCALPFPFASAL
jgi:hypothetical protein